MSAELWGASWRKSSRSGGAQGCVEVAQVAELGGVRDSKHPGGPEMVLPGRSWERFIDAARNGTLDL